MLTKQYRTAQPVIGKGALNGKWMMCFKCVKDAERTIVLTIHSTELHNMPSERCPSWEMDNVLQIMSRLYRPIIQIVKDGSVVVHVMVQMQFRDTIWMNVLQMQRVWLYRMQTQRMCSVYAMCGLFVCKGQSDGSDYSFSDDNGPSEQ